MRSLQVIAPVLPFLSDHLWRNLVRGGEPSVHLAAWPEVPDPDVALLAEIAEVRRVVELARQARSSAGLKLRQPLARMIVAGAPLAASHAAEIGEELRMKEVVSGEAQASELRVKPNLRLLGPKLGAGLQRYGRRSPPGASPSSTAAASRSTASCSSLRRCSSNGSAWPAGRSPATVSSPLRSTRASTTRCGSRRG